MHGLCGSRGRVEEEEAACMSFLLAPVDCKSGIIRALWILGEGESWCRLSCTPGEMGELKAGIETPFCTTVFGLSFFFFHLYLYFPLLLRVSGLERKQRWVSTCNLAKLHWSFISKCCIIQRHCDYCCERFQPLPISSKVYSTSILLLCTHLFLMLL